MTHSFAIMAEAKPQTDMADSWIEDVLRPLRKESLDAEIDMIGGEREAVKDAHRHNRLMRATWIVAVLILSVWCVS